MCVDSILISCLHVPVQEMRSSLLLIVFLSGCSEERVDPPVSTKTPTVSAGTLRSRSSTYTKTIKAAPVVTVPFSEIVF
jgi:hypothetical protein